MPPHTPPLPSKETRAWPPEGRGGGGFWENKKPRRICPRIMCSWRFDQYVRDHTGPGAKTASAPPPSPLLQAALRYNQIPTGILSFQDVCVQMCSFFSKGSRSG